ncbi:response regulator transcription factor [Sphaerisporangium sp. NPDC049002]|uniref:helix-turn-helix transcriptional regulator n=1 Tax=unclassified Sphaerisporangium TaxID=2630420 RepID=UPI0033D9D21A
MVPTETLVKEKLSAEARSRRRLAGQRVFMIGGWPALETASSRAADPDHGKGHEFWFRDTLITRGTADMTSLPRQVRGAQPHWLLIGQMLNEEDLPELVAKCQVMAPMARLAMLGALKDRGRAEAWVRRGCTVYLAYNSTLDRVLDTLKIAALLDLQIVDYVMYLRWQRSMPKAPHLTDRQQQVLELIKHGHTNAEIAKELYLTQHTVEFHIRHLLQKLGARNRTEAAEMGHALGIC